MTKIRLMLGVSFIITMPIAFLIASYEISKAYVEAMMEENMGKNK